MEHVKKPKHKRTPNTEKRERPDETGLLEHAQGTKVIVPELIREGYKDKVIRLRSSE